MSRRTLLNILKCEYRLKAQIHRIHSKSSLGKKKCFFGTTRPTCCKRRMCYRDSVALHWWKLLIDGGIIVHFYKHALLSSLLILRCLNIDGLCMRMNRQVFEVCIIYIWTSPWAFS